MCGLFLFSLLVPFLGAEQFVFPLSDVGCTVQAAQARLGKGRKMGTSRGVQKELGAARRKAILYKENLRKNRKSYRKECTGLSRGQILQGVTHCLTTSSEKVWGDPHTWIRKIIC